MCRQGKSCVNKIMFFCSLSFHRKPVQGNYLKKSPCGLGKCAREAGFAQRIPGQLALPAPEPNSADQVGSDYTDEWLENNTAAPVKKEPKANKKHKRSGEESDKGAGNGGGVSGHPSDLNPTNKNRIERVS